MPAAAKGRLIKRVVKIPIVVFTDAGQDREQPRHRARTSLSGVKEFRGET
jgi:hypothetical protein